MASDFKVKVTDKVSPALIRRIRLSRNLTPVFRKIGKFELRQTRRRISLTKKSPDNIPWAGWKPSTLKARIAKGTASNGLLYDTKTMHDMFILQYTNNHMSLRPGVDYASYLHFGVPGKMAARPFMGWSKPSEEFIRRSFIGHFK